MYLRLGIVRTPPSSTSSANPLEKYMNRHIFNITNVSKQGPMQFRNMLKRLRYYSITPPTTGNTSLIEELEL